MKYPLVLIADDGPHLFDSADALIRDLEPIDVENGEYTVYDSEGRLLPLVTTRRDLGPVGILFDKRIVLQESAELRTQQLREVVIDFLHKVGKGQANDAHVGLPELLQRLRDYAQAPNP
jgi:hypothetical protein